MLHICLSEMLSRFLLLNSLYILQTWGEQKLSRSELMHRSTSDHDPEQRHEDGKDLTTFKCQVLNHQDPVLRAAAYSQPWYTKEMQIENAYSTKYIKEHRRYFFPQYCC